MVEEECKKFKNDTIMKKVAGNQNSKKWSVSLKNLAEFREYRVCVRQKFFEILCELYMMPYYSVKTVWCSMQQNKEELS